MKFKRPWYWYVGIAAATITAAGSIWICYKILTLNSKDPNPSPLEKKVKSTYNQQMNMEATTRPAIMMDPDRDYYTSLGVLVSQDFSLEEARKMLRDNKYSFHEISLVGRIGEWMVKECEASEEIMRIKVDPKDADYYRSFGMLAVAFGKLGEKNPMGKAKQYVHEFKKYLRRGDTWRNASLILAPTGIAVDFLPIPGARLVGAGISSASILCGYMYLSGYEVNLLLLNPKVSINPNGKEIGIIDLEPFKKSFITYSKNSRMSTNSGPMASYLEKLRIFLDMQHLLQKCEETKRDEANKLYKKVGELGNELGFNGELAIRSLIAGNVDLYEIEAAYVILNKVLKSENNKLVDYFMYDLEKLKKPNGTPPHKKDTTYIRQAVIKEINTKANAMAARYSQARRIIRA